MSQHIIKSIIHLIRGLLNLEFLSVDLVLDIVDSVVQLGDVHLTILEPRFICLSQKIKVKE